MPPPSKKKMGETLIDKGLITADQLATALEYQKSVGGPFGQVVVKLGFITSMDLTDFLAKQYGLGIVDLPAMVIPVDLVKTVPWNLIKKHKILPIHLDGMTLTICTSDPTDYNAIEEIQFATGKQIDLNLAPLTEITKVITRIENKELKGTKQQDYSGAISSSKPQGNEDGVVESIRTRSSGRLKTVKLDKSQLREALIPLLIRKGVITQAELHEAVGELLLKKGVIKQKDVDTFLKG